MIVGLLFLGLAFFAVGQAGANRNGTQSGADAAALAAAQESRDDLEELLFENILDPDFLRDFFGGGAQWLDGGSCGDAAGLAAANDTTLLDCGPTGDGRWGRVVRVEAGRPVGDTLIPGTENDRATARATAVVESRCDFEPAEDEPDPTPTPTPTPSGEPEEPGEPGEPGEPTEPAEPPVPGLLRCDDRDFEIDPARPDLFPRMSDLFTVRLDRD
ncbi:pilus assembly protein TadG-related protein [Streptomyces yaizuensis]|uniref:Pilus assembly protein TadG-related protein n=1 Tax=Streptomyces yaizuensis TaxID=2989713 RepID=A0ABQ5NVH9_9ACTN|nr:pilus assembly protein TadG-related protein [Streptomyces sp. YSPA8]